MAISKAEFSAFIKTFRFRELFNEMGWNNDRAKQQIVVDDASFSLSGVAEKGGFMIFACSPVPGNKLPDAATRKKIENKLTRLFQEHLIIFIDEHKREQVWQLAVRKAGSPTKISETRYNLSQDPELLYQCAGGLFFTLDEEEKVTIIDVTRRVAENFQQNNEKVTKKFYEGFKKEHTAFLKFITGIDDRLSMDWYASLMLNRLMFCYFIQKKGFLDNNLNYLQDKLKTCKTKNGSNQFYSFYRDFLLALFHQGLGAPEHGRDLEIEIGKIPYLNGGLFDEHEIEKTYRKIAIDDSAFEQLFEFFDQYEWHLDTRETASGKDINPDVIGYIFEKYINDRAQMGAYYTKEDITDYIGKNCIIPWLFDEVKRQYPKAFAGDGPVWQMVKNSGDDYIYDAVKYGVPENLGLFDDLPEEIRQGFKPELEQKVVDGNGEYLWELRREWNKPAPSAIALPTEIYREVIERRKRYAEIKGKIKNGEISEINDFITSNLNIRQFAQDVVETNEDAEFIRHFYQALSSVTILDPTCGSGAFLFAAMNILEPLYEACIYRMKNFIAESGKGRHKFFDKTLEQVNAPEHPNLQYFIFKSIILNNLYGVDIMNEAVEIAKLRLFLKLVATVDADYRKPNLGLEPLPDVDFNIRAGNTLIGYATEKQLAESLSSDLLGQFELPAIKEKCDIVGMAFARYKEIQLQGHADFQDFKEAKDDLNTRLDTLRNELDVLLHKQSYSSMKYDRWLSSHKPFHWFAEFYEIINGKGGFDVVIGNPPYVEYNPKDIKYTLINYDTIDCGDLYAFVMERAIKLVGTDSLLGMIIPISIASTDAFSSLRKLMTSRYKFSFFSTYSIRPSKLFDGVEKRLCIFIGNKANSTLSQNICSTRYHVWSTEQRDSLFEILHYIERISLSSIIPSIPKIGTSEEQRIINCLSSGQKSIGIQTSRNSKNVLYHTRKLRYFVQFLDSPPKIIDSKGKQKVTSELKELLFDKPNYRDVALATYNSSLFYWFYIAFSDCRNVNKREVHAFPLDFSKMNQNVLSPLSVLSGKLMKNLQENSIMQTTTFKKYGTFDIQIFQPRLSKPVIDQIDSLLARHYGFTHEELDFIINYDIKYRMGKELDSGEDEE